MSLQKIQALIADVPDFPKPGIIFRDITPLLADPEGFRLAVERLADETHGLGADAILAIEARGFIFGAALAQKLALPLQLVRKSGKLPRQTTTIRYELEYGTDQMEVHADALQAGARYLIVDDLIATGGTAAAVSEMVERRGAVIAGYAFLIELAFLKGRERLGDAPFVHLLTY